MDDSSPIDSANSSIDEASGNQANEPNPFTCHAMRGFPRKSQWCGNHPVDLDLLIHFKESVCSDCKARDRDYSFISHLSCKEEYQLTEDEIESLRYWEKEQVIQLTGNTVRKNIGSRLVRLYLLKHVLEVLEKRKKNGPVRPKGKSKG